MNQSNNYSTKKVVTFLYPVEALRDNAKHVMKDYCYNNAYSAGLSLKYSTLLFSFNSIILISSITITGHIL
jgi:hypothetical protein